jgi:hypothetical protein
MIAAVSPGLRERYEDREWAWPRVRTPCRTAGERRHGDGAQLGADRPRPGLRETAEGLQLDGDAGVPIRPVRAGRRFNAAAYRALIRVQPRLASAGPTSSAIPRHADATVARTSPGSAAGPVLCSASSSKSNAMLNATAGCWPPRYWSWIVVPRSVAPASWIRARAYPAGRWSGMSWRSTGTGRTHHFDLST